MAVCPRRRQDDVRVKRKGVFRLAYPNRMRMVLVDGKHFRAGQARLKRVAFFFIDDCSRRVLGQYRHEA